MNIPNHVAIIMDGNGRWATARHLPRTAGHKAGAETLKKVLAHLKKRGVKYVTLYAFSSENWGRPKEEVDTLIGLFRDYLKNDIEQLHKENTRVSFIGNRYKFPEDIVLKMNEIEAKTALHTDFHVVLALSYGARDDIIEAVKRIASDVVDHRLTISSINPEIFADALSTRTLPDPDLVIRTSGEERLSNFLLWEVAYAEFYWTDVMWPDFDEKQVDKALEAYAARKRRFGKV